MYTYALRIEINFVLKAFITSRKALWQYILREETLGRLFEKNFEKNLWRAHSRTEHFEVALERLSFTSEIYEVRDYKSRKKLLKERLGLNWIGNCNMGQKFIPEPHTFYPRFFPIHFYIVSSEGSTHSSLQ